MGEMELRDDGIEYTDETIYGLKNSTALQSSTLDGIVFFIFVMKY